VAGGVRGLVKERGVDACKRVVKALEHNVRRGEHDFEGRTLVILQTGCRVRLPERTSSGAIGSSTLMRPACPKAASAT
jgi:hypothetical protein